MKIENRINSFAYAFKGLGIAFKAPNARIQLTIATVSLFLSIFFNLNLVEWICIVFCCGIVLAAETFNTALEQLVDMVQPERNPKAGMVKDLAAGASLICCFTALIVGLIIFIPKLIVFFDIL